MERWLYRDGLNPIAELDGSTPGALVSRFVYGSRPNVPDLVMRGGQTYRLIDDHLGSPRGAVNVRPDILEIPYRVDYTAFGEAIPAGGLAATVLDWIPFGFAGGLYDRDTGLVRFGARDYDPQVGRWVSKDPIRFGGGQSNIYVYVNNDPVNALDPLGLGDCSYYDARCTQNGGSYYCVQAPYWCDKFPDDDWSNCTRDCLQDCDSALHPSNNNYSPGYDDAREECVGFSDEEADNSMPWQPWTDFGNFACHAACYSGAQWQQGRTER